ncbi:7TM diverse intracellular signaling domain-containing protein [Hugenholtzia roseola]|uniref:7TM diverse intracellular signaling domain-containing protein n=1 Tax=Hugenholtzia roseola TaxID=1002 RepID=UPI0003FC621E|nr:7TM diverse intracellular signaling domain-containing protein [Hugenholtzia roseola]
MMSNFCKKINLNVLIFIGTLFVGLILQKDAQGQHLVSPLQMLNPDSTYHLAKNLHFFPSPDGKEKIEQVSDSAFFAANFGDTLILEEKHQYIWLYFEVENLTPQRRWYLQADQYKAFLYQQIAPQKWKEQIFGFNTTWEEAANIFSKYDLPLVLEKGKNAFFLKAEIENCGCSFDFHQRRARAFFIEAEPKILSFYAKQYLFEIFVLSGILFLLIYNFFIGIYTRSLTYIFYTLTTVGFWFYILIGSNLFRNSYLNWFDYKNILIYLMNISVSCAAIFFILFALSFFRFKGNRILIRTFYVSIILLLVIVFYFLFITVFKKSYSFHNNIVIVSNYMYVFLVVAMLLFSFLKWREKAAAARIFFLSNFIPWLLMGYYAFLVILSVQITSQILNYLYAAVSLQVLFFSIALAQRFNLIKKQVAEKQLEKEQLERQKALEMQNLIAQKNAELEQKVVIRTKEIVSKNEELNQIIEELDVTNEKLQEAFGSLETQHLQITDSIRYALTIQEAVLPKAQVISQSLPQNAILFLPRNVVSGDFYWFADLGGRRTLLGVFDCTGHGVPGAFMSLISIQILNEIVFVKKINEPAAILAALQTAIYDRLRQEETQNKDGLDAALLLIDQVEKEVLFAGAKNPLYYLAHSKKEIQEEIQEEIMEIKGDNIFIGGESAQTASFTQHKLSFAQNKHTFFIASDGYQDQFGGEAAKKMMKKGFKNNLKAAAKLPIHEVDKFLYQRFQAWKKDEEQTDDVLVIALRLG